LQTFRNVLAAHTLHFALSSLRCSYVFPPEIAYVGKSLFKRMEIFSFLPFISFGDKATSIRIFSFEGTGFVGMTHPWESRAQL
jgi:hypothetical protein